MEIKTSQVLIVGRGPTITHFPWNSLKNTTTIGINISSFKAVKFMYTYSTSELLSIYRNEFEEPPISVGSIYFSLGMLLDILHRKSTGNLKIGLIGFDFDGHTPDDDIDKRATVGLVQRRLDIYSQREAFSLIKNSYAKFQIVRFGFDSFSDIDPRKGWITSTESKVSNKVEIVAEITTNHHGSTEKLEKLINGAFAAGADSVKLQKRDVESFYSSEKLSQPYSSPFGKTFRDYRLALELTDEQIRLAEELTQKLGLRLFFSTLDLRSYQWIIKRGYSRIKLPSTISRNKDFIGFVAKNPPEEVIISTGMTDIDYQNWVINEFRNVEKLYLLQCTSSYPTYYKDVNIGVVNRYQELSRIHTNIIPGLSSHDVGSLGSCMAVAAGARMIEKHIKTGINEWSHFDDTALDVDTSFVDFCKDVRRAEFIYGNEVKEILDSEHHKY